MDPLGVVLVVLDISQFVVTNAEKISVASYINVQLWDRNEAMDAIE